MAVNVLTTNIVPRLYDWLNTQTKVENVTKRVLIEEALEELRVKKLKAAMRESMIRAAKDPEIQAMSEWGMDTYAEELNKIDGGYPQD